MTVDPEHARAKGLAITYEDHEYVFCGKGRCLDFRDDPEPFLRPGFVASMKVTRSNTVAAKQARSR